MSSTSNWLLAATAVSAAHGAVFMCSFLAYPFAVHAAVLVAVTVFQAAAQWLKTATTAKL
jgi:hypothetical protein